jgi:hypothetical protein
MDYSSLLEKLPIVINVFSKIYSFWEKTIGVKKAKKKLSLAFQECLKPQPNVQLIKRTLTQYKGRRFIKPEVEELNELLKGVKLTFPKKDVHTLKADKVGRKIQTGKRVKISAKGERIIIRDKRKEKSYPKGKTKTRLGY